MSKLIHLGFEVTAGAPVEVPVRHMVVTGQTQESGKTTTLEALIRRAELPAIAFLTKRGEGSLAGRPILPFFKDRADWQFVESILESTMKERKKFERPWIMRACEGARTLSDVQHKVEKLFSESRPGLNRDMYMMLGEYLKRVVPLVASLPQSTGVDVDLVRGLGVMDLTRYPEELQMLVLASTLEWIHKNSAGVITVIPEAWKFIPEGKNTPVKVVAEKLAREGAALKNFIWIDSQDIAGVAKLLLRACSVWLIGVQREANEIKRSLANMPEGMKRPKAGDVATLKLGQFYCCFGTELRKVYVQPVWMDPAHARKVALGKADPYELARVRPAGAAAPAETEDEMWREKVEELTQELQDLRGQITRLQREKEDLCRQLAAGGKAIASVAPAPLTGAMAPVIPAPPLPAHDAPSIEWQGWWSGVTEGFYVRILEALRRDPVLIRLAVEKPAIELTITKKVLPLEDSTIKGKIARLMSEGFFTQPRKFAEVRAELLRRGLDRKTSNVQIAVPLKDLTELGFFYRGEGDSYELAPDAEVREVCA